MHRDDAIDTGGVAPNPDRAEPEPSAWRAGAAQVLPNG